MSIDSCGDCINFKPEKNDKFFNCTCAKQAGIRYGMQVRADTRKCDAFVPLSPAPMPKPLPSKGRAQPAECQIWKRIFFLIVLLIAILLLSWLIYACATGSTTQPASTPIPVPGNTSGPTTYPTPTLANYTTIYYDLSPSTPAIAPDRIITVYASSRISSYTLLTGRVISAPPGYTFIFISLNAFNLGNSALSIQAGDFTLLDFSGMQYTPQLEGSQYYIGNPFGSVLAPGKTDDGKLLYIVPATASGLELSYLLNPDSEPPVIARWRIPG